MGMVPAHNSDVRTTAFSDRGDVVVVRKQNHLRGAPQLDEQVDGGRSTTVVEVNQQVVGDEWQRLGARDMRFDGGNAQREEKLVASSLTQAVDGAFGPVALNGQQHGFARRIQVSAEPGVTPARQVSKVLAGGC